MPQTSLRDPLARTRRLAALVVPLLAVGACSSGGSGGKPSPAPASTTSPSTSGVAPVGSAGTTTNAPATTRGALADGGELSVNGTSFDGTDTVYTSDGLPVTRDQLAPGMQVRVSSDGASASMVEYDDDVSGPVDVVNVDGSLSVLGQSVTLAPGANVSLPGSGAFTAGDVVEVSGMRTADGAIEATYVAPESQPEDYEVRGTVADLDPVAMTFTLGGLTVDYTAAMLSGFGAGAPANGDAVEVSDPSLTYEPGSFLLVVADVELAGTETDDDGLTAADGQDAGLEDGLDDGEAADDGLEDGLDDGESADDGLEDGLDDGETADDGQDRGADGEFGPQDEFDGGGDYQIVALVTSVESADAFSVGDVRVRISGSTVFRNGDRSMIAPDARVEVEGTLAADGVLDATAVEFDTRGGTGSTLI